MENRDLVVIIAIAGVEINDLSSVIVCFLFGFYRRCATVLFHLLILSEEGQKVLLLFLAVMIRGLVKRKAEKEMMEFIVMELYTGGFGE